MNGEQLVILMTKEGTAYNERNLKQVWKTRCKEQFPHYEVVAVKILKKRTD